MAYNYGADIAEGKSLQAKPTIFTGLIGEEMKLDYERQKAKAEKVGKPIDLDLKDETKDRLPYFSEQAIQVHKDVINQFQSLKDKGYSDAQAETAINRDMFKYQQRINDINTSNAAALKLYNANSGTILTGDKANAQKIFENRNATSKDLQSLNNPDAGINVSSDGNFSYTPIEYESPAAIVKKYDQGNFDVNQHTFGTPYKLGEKTKQDVSIPFVPAPQAIDTATNEILTGKQGGNFSYFKNEVYPNLPDQYKSLPEYKDFNSDNTDTRIKAQRALVSKVVADSMRKPDHVESIDYTPPQSKQQKVEGNTWTQGDVTVTYNESPVNGTITVIPENNKKKLVDRNWYDASGQPFNGTMSHMEQQQGALPVVKVTKTLEPDDGITLVDLQTGENISNDTPKVNGKFVRYIRDAKGNKIIGENGQPKTEPIADADIYKRNNPRQKEQVEVTVPYTNSTNKANATADNGNRSYEQIKAKFQGKGFGSETNTKSSKTGKPSTPSTAPKTQTLKKSYTMDGKSYSVDDLRKLGYSDGEILGAAEKGLLK